MDHWQLAIDYIGGLFRLELNGETSRTGLFNGLIIPRGNHNVSIQWSFGKILEIENFEDPTHNALGGTATYTNTSRVEFTGVVTGPPNVPHQTWAMKADIEGGTYRADIPQANRDFSQFKLLTFRMTSEFDTTSRDTIRDGRLPKFIVRFWFGKPDGSSGFAEVDQRSLDLRGVRERNRPFFHRICIPQGIGGHTIGILAVNVTKIVFDTLAIPLTRFAGVNWHNIQAVEFVAGLGIEKKLGVPAKSQATNIVPIYVASIAVSQA